VSFTLIIHIKNSEPVTGEIDELPSPSDTLIGLNHPRRLDGKDLNYLSEDAVTVFWPVEQLNFVEVVSGEKEEAIIGFVRE
jgi:hypothetical protein